MVRQLYCSQVGEIYGLTFIKGYTPWASRHAIPFLQCRCHSSNMWLTFHEGLHLATKILSELLGACHMTSCCAPCSGTLAIDQQCMDEMIKSERKSRGKSYK